MTFREALEREIAVQGISVAEVADKSGVSKGTIYNILNGTTEEERIRAATRRAIARGCERDIEVMPDGGIVFIDPRQTPAGITTQTLRLSLIPFCSFRSQGHLSAAFDWLHPQEESGRLKGVKTVDRVFQQRDDFLELELFNQGEVDILKIEFILHVVFDKGVVGDIPCAIEGPIGAGQTQRRSLFLSGGPGFHLTLTRVSCVDEDRQSWQISQVPNYRFQGDVA